VRTVELTKSPENSLALLAAHSPFATLPPQALSEVADALCEEHYEAGSEVFAEGDLGDRLFIVVRGSAELSCAGSVGPVPLTVLEPGDLVGELALLSRGRERNATMTALTPLVLVSLGAEAFEQTLLSHPETRAAFDEYAEDLLVARFIKQVGPFMTLDDAERQALAKRLVKRTAAAGEMIVRQGERAESCYLLRAGEAEVILDEGTDGQRRVDVIRPGSLFGETALLTDAPRCASVRALEQCALFELKREDLASVVRQDQAVGHETVQLLRLRERPRRAQGVLVAERLTPEGETLTVLKNPECLTYHRLSERGRFVWERLDGSRNLKDLTLDVYKQFGQLAPDAIANIVGGLSRTGMIQTKTISSAIGRDALKQTRRGRTLAAARRALEKEFWLHDVDRIASAVYKGGVRRLFTLPGQIILAAIAVAGLAAFVLLATSAHRTLGGSQGELLLLVIPGFFVAVVLHESGHAFTVKAFGREVNRAGVGWYWFGPVAFVDTSDMWLASRRERILVSLAGPYTDMVVAGTVCLVALAVSNATVTAVLWSFALPSYLAVLANLNPMLAYDGYYVLSDLLDRPNLRSEALAWVRSRFPHFLRDRRDLRRHRVDFLYGVGSVIYILGSAAAVVVLYRLVVQGWINSVLPGSIAEALAWVFALLVSLLAVLGLIADLRRPRPGPFDTPNTLAVRPTLDG
jgi:putative peptide zinc metalloprotease protein